MVVAPNSPRRSSSSNNNNNKQPVVNRRRIKRKRRSKSTMSSSIVGGGDNASEQYQQQQRGAGACMDVASSVARRIASSASSSNNSNNKTWFPSRYEDTDDVVSDPYHPRHQSTTYYYNAQNNQNRMRPRRSMKRRIFLLLTEPDTSIASAIFFFILIISISLMNIVMIMQTMNAYQFTPSDCRSCGGSNSYLFDDDYSIERVPVDGVECVCPPSPLAWTGTFLSGCIYFFTVEWTLRVLCFEPNVQERRQQPGLGGYALQWISFLLSPSTVLDALAIFPYYIEMDFSTNGLMSLRLLRLFRVFQLVRLGQYNDTFMSLSNVLFKGTLHLKLFFGVLMFGAAIFGSLLYWLEKGDWKYYEPTQSYQFVRQTTVDGEEEISPFTSIPECFWWFFVTATTVGYGDSYPTSTPGKWVGIATMLMGVLVIAFPVSVFSDLWSKELRRTGFLTSIDDDDDDDEIENERGALAASAAAARVSELGKTTTTFLNDETSPLLYHETSSTSPSPSTRMAAELASSQQHQHHTTTNTTNTAAASASERDFVRIHKNDLAEIVAGMKLIEDEQRRLKSILRRYRHYGTSKNAPG